MTYSQFASALAPLVERVGGSTAAAEIFGVTRQTVNRWLRAEGNPPAAVTQHGALDMLRKSTAKK